MKQLINSPITLRFEQLKILEIVFYFRFLYFRLTHYQQASFQPDDPWLKY